MSNKESQLEATRIRRKRIRNIQTYLEDRNIICDQVILPETHQPVLSKEEKEDPQSQINSKEIKLIGKMVNKSKEKNFYFQIEIDRETDACIIRPQNAAGKVDNEAIYGNHSIVEKNHQILPILECHTLESGPVNA